MVIETKSKYQPKHILVIEANHPTPWAMCSSKSVINYMREIGCIPRGFAAGEVMVIGEPMKQLDMENFGQIMQQVSNVAECLECDIIYVELDVATTVVDIYRNYKRKYCIVEDKSDD